MEEAGGSGYEIGVVLTCHSPSLAMNFIDFAVGSKWFPIEPDIDVPEPINGFAGARAPTVPREDADVQPLPKKSFSNRFDRPVFEGRKIVKETYTKPDGTRGIKRNTTIRIRGGPRNSFLQKHSLSKDSLAVEFADAYFPMFENKETDNNGDPYLSMEYLTRNTNMRATLAFAGEATYDEWSGPFTIKELRQHIGLYVLNGLSPSPSIELKFNKEDNANFNMFCFEHFGSNAVRRHRQFKAFLGCQDPRKPTPLIQHSSPLFKVLSVVKWIRKLGPLSWQCGVDLALDEQTIGFQGHHADKQRITYKKEGDGFQCDALCDDGYTYSVYFRNEPPPPKCNHLSPLHARSLWLFDQLTDHYHHVWVDNLYMSAKFAKTAFNLDNKVMTAGVARTKDRGVPRCVIQEPVKKKSELTTTRGLVKAAVLKGGDNCPDLVSISIMDNKPVHFITMVAESLQWIEKTRQVWNKTAGRNEDIKFLRMNINNDYNCKMNPVDVADQLRNHYQMDHWIRQRKWLWSIFMWRVGVLLTNSYKTYCRVMDDAGVPRSQRLTHYDYLHAIASSWIDKNEVDIRKIRKLSGKKRRHEEVLQDGDDDDDDDDQSPVSNKHQTPTTEKKNLSTPSKAPRICDAALNPDKGLLRLRLNHFGVFHCSAPPVTKIPSCALHRWIHGRDAHSGGQTRGKIVTCTHCKVNLCIEISNASKSSTQCPIWLVTRLIC